MLSRPLAVMVSMVVLFACMGDPACASGKRRDKSAVMEVPTSGKILDVVYRPEFDEWWVKCREGDTICIYSYDSRAREWGKILFVPKKPDERAKAIDKSRPSGDADKTKAVPMPDKVEDARQARQGLGQQPARKDHKTDAKWWDPFKILKQGEKFIHPLRTDENR